MGGLLLEFLSLHPLHPPLGVLRRRRHHHPFRHFSQKGKHMVQRKMRVLWIVVLMPVLVVVVQLQVQGPR